MCREDLKMGRKKYTKITTVQCPAGAKTALIGEAKNRVHLQFSSSIETGMVGPSEVNLAGGVGIPVSFNNAPTEFDIAAHGTIVTFSWFGSGTSAAAGITVIETFFDDGAFP